MGLLNKYHNNYIFVMVLIFAILPILLAISTFYKINYAEEIILFSSEYFEDIYFGFQLLSLFQYGIFVAMLILYPIYPAAFSVRRYFMRGKDQRSAIKEYQILKKIVYALFPFFIFAFVYLIGARLEENPLTGITKVLSNFVPSYLLVIAIGVIFFIVASALLKIIVLITRTEFRYYFSKMLFKILLEKGDESKTTRYMVKAIDSYNKYIRRSVGLQINDIKRIYSKILSDPSFDKNCAIRKISTSFEDEDKFMTIKCLSTLLGITDTEHFLTKESIGKKIEDGAAMIGTIVSTIAAVIGVLATIGIPGLS